MKQVLENATFIYATAIMLCTCFTAKAQDVDGISLWDKCTKEQLIEKYGQPVKYSSQEENELGWGRIEEIVFKDAHFRLEGNQLTEFDIDSSKPRTMTKHVSGGIRLGDSEAVLKQIEMYLFKRMVLNDGEILYRYIADDNDDEIYISTKDGIITEIFARARTC